MTVDTDELVAWLREALDEDERAACSATAGPWTAHVGEGLHDDVAGWVGANGVTQGGVFVASVSDSPDGLNDVGHIARWDPARVLAEVEAKRRILDAVVPSDRPHETPWGGCDDECEWKVVEWAVRVLAQPYAGRPGFKPEWRLT